MRTIGGIAVLSLVALSACRSFNAGRPDDTEWMGTTSFEAIDREIVWTVLELEIAMRGFDLDEQLTNRGTGDFETRWSTAMNPFRFEGKRKKIIGRVEPVEDRPGFYRIRATFWVQRNEDITDPMNPLKAIWRNEASDQVATEVFLYALESHFAPSEQAPPPAQK